jgi:hypothetical protein
MPPDVSAMVVIHTTFFVLHKKNYSDCNKVPGAQLRQGTEKRGERKGREEEVSRFKQKSVSVLMDMIGLGSGLVTMGHLLVFREERDG